MLTRNDNYKSTRNCYIGGNTIKYIVVHYTGCFAPAKNFCLSQMNNDLGGSAHDFVDDNEWYCAIDHINRAWAVGDNQGYGVYPNGITNSNSLNIEMCCCNANLDVSEQTIKNTAEIVAYYMKVYGVTIDRVKRHYDASYKQCPRDMSPNVTNGQTNWEAFKSLVEKYLNGEKEEEKREEKELVGGMYKMPGQINMRVKYKDKDAEIWTKWYNMDTQTCDPYKNFIAMEIYTEIPLRWEVLINKNWIGINGSGVIEAKTDTIKGFRAKVSDGSKKVYYWVSSPGDVSGYAWWENACCTNGGDAICRNSGATTPLNAIKIRLG